MSLPEDDLGPVRAGRARKAVVYHRLARPQRRHGRPSFECRDATSCYASFGL